MVTIYAIDVTSGEILDEVEADPMPITDYDNGFEVYQYIYSNDVCVIFESEFALAIDTDPYTRDSIYDGYVRLAHSDGNSNLIYNSGVVTHRKSYISFDS